MCYVKSPGNEILFFVILTPAEFFSPEYMFYTMSCAVKFICRNEVFMWRFGQRRKDVDFKGAFSYCLLLFNIK